MLAEAPPQSPTLIICGTQMHFITCVLASAFHHALSVYNCPGLLRLFIPSHCSRNCSWAPATGLPLAIQFNASPAKTAEGKSLASGSPASKPHLNHLRNANAFHHLHLGKCISSRFSVYNCPRLLRRFCASQ